MSFWDFLSLLDDTTLVIVLSLAVGALVALCSTVIIALVRVPAFLLSFAQLPKDRRRSALELVKRLHRALGR